MSRDSRGRARQRRWHPGPTTAPPAQPVDPPTPREEVTPREPWAPHLRDTGNGADLRAELMSIDWLLHGPSTRERQPYVLPPWQRGQVWTPAQQVAFCEAVWYGMPFQPILLWQRDGYKGAPIVLDGQQRLCALGAYVLRADGTPNAPTAAHLDLETGRWQVGPADGHPPITMAHAASTGWLHDEWTPDGRADLARWRTSSLVAEASERLRGGRSFVYTIGTGVPVEDVIRIFRVWNTPGVAFPPDEVEALIRAADLSWTSPIPSGDPGTTPRG